MSILMPSATDPASKGAPVHFDLGSGRPTGEIRKLTSLLEVSQALADTTNFRGVAAPRGSRSSRNRTMPCAAPSRWPRPSRRRSKSWRRPPGGVTAPGPRACRAGRLPGRCSRRAAPSSCRVRPRAAPWPSRAASDAERDVRLRAAAAEPPRDRRPVPRAPLQGGPRLRAHRQVLRRRRLDDRAGDQGAAAGRGRAAAPGRRRTRTCGGSCASATTSRTSSAPAARCARSTSRWRRSRAPTPPCCIRGESGTGKELIAHAIHYNSQRADEAVRQGQLRGAARHADRVGALRLREGRVHRRRSAASRAASSWPTAARCSSTRSATSTSRPRSSCCACCRSASSSASAASSRSRSTSG